MWALAFGPWLAHGGSGREIEPLHRGGGQELRRELAAGLPAFGHHPTHGTALAQVPGEAPGVDALEHRNARLGQPLVEALRGAPVRRIPAHLAHDDAGHLRTAR